MNKSPDERTAPAPASPEHEPMLDVGQRVALINFPDVRGSVVSCDIYGHVRVALDDGNTGHFAIIDLACEECFDAALKGAHTGADPLAGDAARPKQDDYNGEKAPTNLLAELDDTFCDLGQLVNAWKMTTPKEQWSEWDEQTRMKMSAAHVKVFRLRHAKPEQPPVTATELREIAKQWIWYHPDRQAPAVQLMRVADWMERTR